MTTMKDFANRVLSQMSRRERADCIVGNLEPAVWVAGKCLGFNEDQAYRVAESVRELLMQAKG